MWLTEQFRQTRMGLGRSLAFFGIPGALMVFGVRVLVPYTMERGWPLIVSFPLFLWAPVIALCLLVVGGFYATRTREQTFAERFRFRRISGRTWLWIVGGFFVVQVFELLFSPTRLLLSEFFLFSPPVHTPELFHPALRIEDGLSHLFGQPMEGQWWLILFWMGWLVINIGGEEILWRGYALPLQERAFGKHAWLVNGIVWNLMVHAFMPWAFLSLLPISLILPYLAQRQQNTWVGVIIHGVGNLLFLGLIIAGIAG